MERNMTTDKPTAGYREIEHTADWELEVWAPDFPTLLVQAARGMAALSGVRLEPGPREERTLELSAGDRESLLVSLLSELLWLGEEERLGFDEIEVDVAGDTLVARLKCAPIASQDKEIKAVTYHNLAVRDTPSGVEVSVVFDV
jgi:SHS2 domain-containing protein